MHQRQQFFQNSRYAPGVEQVFHLVFAGRAQVGDERGAAADPVEKRQGQVDAQAAGDGRQMDEGVGAAAQLRTSRVMAFSKACRVRICDGRTPSCG